jgi:trehalose 6-phosphate phosphatase
MKSALSPGAISDLRTFLQGHLLLAFDLDGTLAPIAPRPEDARVPDDVQQLLAALAVRTPLAIVTGRAVRDARRMLWFTPRYFVGNHGAEGIPGREVEGPAYTALCRRWQAAIIESGIQNRLPGTLLEDKGYSLALHYRLARHPEQARDALREFIGTLDPAPRVVPGKRVLNLVPAQAPHKGDALRALIAHARAERAVYIGDDITDEDVFELRLPGVRTIRVEPDRESAADFQLARQSDVAVLLRELARILSSAPFSPGGAQHAASRRSGGS